MKKAICLLLAALPAVAGCGTNYALTRPSMDLARSGLFRDPNQISRMEKAMTDDVLADLLDMHVQPRLPTSLGIARLRNAYRGHYELIATDSGEMQAWEEIVRKLPQITGVHPVSPLSVGGDSEVTMHSLRVAAARMNCELLLVCLQADSSVSNFNDAAVLYWTLAGLWLAPGSTLEHKTVMQAILIDCRTGAILGTAGGDCHLKRSCPAAFEDIRRKELADETPAAALADLQKGCGALMKRMVDAGVAKRG